MRNELNAASRPATTCNPPASGGVYAPEPYLKKGTSPVSTNGNGAAAKAAATNGKARYQRDKVRVAIIGVGNCASAFVQGVEYYKNADAKQPVPGLMHVDLGGYHVNDIEFTCAFDINKTKVGKDLGQAIWAKPEQHDEVRQDVRRRSARPSTAA